METDKNEDDEKKKKKRKEFLSFSGLTDNSYIRCTWWRKRCLIFTVPHSSKVWLHQGQWEDYSASRPGETRDCCSKRDNRNSKWISFTVKINSDIISSLNIWQSLRETKAFYVSLTDFLPSSDKLSSAVLL